MRLITSDNICNTLFAQIQTNAIDRGDCHWEGYKNWCIRGEEIEQAIKDIFADDNIFKPTIDIVRCEECKHYTPVEGGKPFCALHITAVAYDDFCSYGERKDNERKAD